MNTLQQETGEIEKQVTKDGEMGFFSKATAMFIINKYPQYSLQSFLNEISTYKNLRKEFFDCMDRQLATAQAEGAAETDELLKIIDWATSDDTGASSENLCRYMLGLPQRRISAPLDAADRGRCIRLLNRIPKWWDRLDEMAQLPSSKVTMFSKNGIETREEGWKEQIPLIKQEALTTKEHHAS